MRNASTDQLGEEITQQYRAFDGTKEEFMAQLPGVTSDQRVDHNYTDWLAGWIKQQKLFQHTSYYCTVVRNGWLYEVYSYGEDDWFCKR
tara:strand:+ start:702 stop:968 length:267 start_codon:yes stop_codon:yes gene_type:complete